MGVKMKTLIAYCTNYGTTEKCAKKLANNLSNDTKLVNLKTTKDVDVNEYDAVIIGGSINAEQIQKDGLKVRSGEVGFQVKLHKDIKMMS